MLHIELRLDPRDRLGLFGCPVIAKFRWKVKFDSGSEGGGDEIVLECDGVSAVEGNKDIDTFEGCGKGGL